ncbi:TPA: flagellar assembly peptidoglycan hydrolase FlgJ [Vibrio parahaemolyticus]|uniref:flagellar assembly peptidoglycan hydrolase FlgJ n=1 Tax=Vibrio parahaemolyticus TaxID=670 RepID=UPI000A37D758|nr:flagellar assembly peptidoglycan hydrolase FlgJ [Vibrio parahaemolyticus]EGQ7783095.1 flagellar assembly peptidoglycan hydrolase FlgJ [Vibrio parahaemolyticus]EGQ9194169.1 flagellar assembly peptidoglycan hydrolase FlgJ [Vibrio parahaemolyticus]EGR2916188.1 flagellar assembly peptidoglycan hydrolase FlgJ [Vibrio parahaemolyticus]ELA7155542.1 flagellar assembly peptidoglycan hydrolase FlgJ [Vibrio parahaemolyticus]ELB2105311.1 flagellar assembly peptidoglycan hydrolase FlgJ [Vibrio parahaemo
MMKNPNDIGFIHDISSLDSLRQKAVKEGKDGEQEALHAAARQFESIFTSMMLKSMREANEGFESNIMNSQNEKFYRQMLDEQMASELSANGSMGLADMIVAQLTAGQGNDKSETAMRDAANSAVEYRRVDPKKAREIEKRLIESGELSRTSHTPVKFDSPESFVNSMKPYAEKAAKALGVEPSLLLAQAALETGWGQKVVQNARGSSNNLFNIKADRSWQGDKVTTQTLEFHDNTPVKETAAFRSYSNYQDSFNDYVRFLNDNPRYETALQQRGDSESFIRGIHRAGYATDPTYADKVLQVKQKIESM